jgi:Kazal-type serine protease inhibitor-like protein
MMSAFRSARMVSFAAAGALSCGDEPVFLATIPAMEAGSLQVPSTCVADTDCPDNAFCSKTGCEAPAGMCVFLPTDCPNEEAPVCGCDRLTYFNDCLRLRNAITSSTPGQCPFGGDVRCDTSDAGPCPTGALCSHFVRPTHGACPPNPPGSCWILPSACPDAGGPEKWASCDPSQTCTDTCNAIASGQIYRPTPRCP